MGDEINNPENIKCIINELYDNTNDYNEECEGIEIYDTNDDNSSNDLDTSWIADHERLYSINENYIREPMDSINAYFVYINRNQYIEKIISDKLDLVLSSDGKSSCLSNETLLQIIQTRKIKTPFSKYKLIDVLCYLVDLEPENIQSYSKNENIENIENIENNDKPGNTFLKVLSIMDDIEINHSIFIFHGINAIYFFFEEVELVNHRHTLKSILKPVEKEISDKTITKKVRIQEGNRTAYKRNKNNHGTRKQITS
jgi:hypothetical protein